MIYEVLNEQLLNSDKVKLVDREYDHFYYWEVLQDNQVPTKPVIFTTCKDVSLQQVEVHQYIIRQIETITKIKF